MLERIYRWVTFFHESVIDPLDDKLWNHIKVDEHHIWVLNHIYVSPAYVRNMIFWSFSHERGARHRKSRPVTRWLLGSGSRRKRVTQTPLSSGARVLRNEGQKKGLKRPCDERRGKKICNNQNRDIFNPYVRWKIAGPSNFATISCVSESVKFCRHKQT